MTKKINKLVGNDGERLSHVNDSDERYFLPPFDTISSQPMSLEM